MSSMSRKTKRKNNLQLHHDCWCMWHRGEVNVGCDGFYLMEAMILMYWRALCAASLWALLQEMPVPWHTVTGEVDSSARHWYWPFTVSSSVGESHAHQNTTQAAKKKCSTPCGYFPLSQLCVLRLGNQLMRRRIMSLEMMQFTPWFLRQKQTKFFQMIRVPGESSISCNTCLLYF